jgi:hypothetical protein
VIVLNGLRSQSRSTDFVRQALVTLQFAILISLLIVVGVVWQQRRFATTEALRVLTDQMLVIRSVCSAPLALLTVSSRSVLVARAPAVSALRYE